MAGLVKWGDVKPGSSDRLVDDSGKGWVRTKAYKKSEVRECFKATLHARGLGRYQVLKGIRKVRVEMPWLLHIETLIYSNKCFRCCDGTYPWIRIKQWIRKPGSQNGGRWVEDMTIKDKYPVRSVTYRSREAYKATPIPGIPGLKGGHFYPDGDTHGETWQPHQRYHYPNGLNGPFRETNPNYDPKSSWHKTSWSWYDMPGFSVEEKKAAEQGGWTGLYMWFYIEVWSDCKLDSDDSDDRMLDSATFGIRLRLRVTAKEGKKRSSSDADGQAYIQGPKWSTPNDSNK